MCDVIVVDGWCASCTRKRSANTASRTARPMFAWDGSSNAVGYSANTGECLRTLRKAAGEQVSLEIINNVTACRVIQHRRSVTPGENSRRRETQPERAGWQQPRRIRRRTSESTSASQPRLRIPATAASQAESSSVVLLSPLRTRGSPRNCSLTVTCSWCARQGLASSQTPSPSVPRRGSPCVDVAGPQTTPTAPRTAVGRRPRCVSTVQERAPAPRNGAGLRYSDVPHASALSPDCSRIGADFSRTGRCCRAAPRAIPSLFSITKTGGA